MKRGDELSKLTN